MEEKQFEVSFDMRNKLALQMLHVTLPPDFVDKINNFIDSKVENLDVISLEKKTKITLKQIKEVLNIIEA